MPAVAEGLRPIDEAIRAIPIEWFRPSPSVYWSDLIASTALGWTAFADAVRSSAWTRLIALAIAVLALYRAVLFIHELTHRSPRELPGFSAVWNALAGVPLMMPSFLYEDVHLDHHRARTYGTPADPEYVPFGKRSPVLMLGFVALSILAPLAFAFRFAIVAPLTWIVPPLRRAVAERFSALAINHAYVRRAAIGRAGRIQEVAGCAFVWLVLALTMAGRLPAAALVCWLVAASAAFGVNAFRTLAAHRYDRDAGELSMTEQLLDSCTIEMNGRHVPPAVRYLVDGARTLVAPVGLRYHALHHWIPSLPYHRLGRTHRLLVDSLRGDAPYRATIGHGFVPALRDLVRRAGARVRA